MLALGGIAFRDQHSCLEWMHLNMNGSSSVCNAHVQAAAAAAPRGLYVCGSTTTSAGLTVAVLRDNMTGDFAIEAGAMVLADRGICCVDEFDKMQQEQQASCSAYATSQQKHSLAGLHGSAAQISEPHAALSSAFHPAAALCPLQSLLGAMEQQEVSIAKAGLLANLPARTSVLAAANPVGGHYQKAKTLAENLRLSRCADAGASDSQLAWRPALGSREWPC